MRSLNDWIDRVNESENNMTAAVINEGVTVWTYGSHAVDIAVLQDIDVSEELSEVLDFDIDMLELEIYGGLPSPTVITGVDPYGLTAYIKAAY